MEGKGIPASEKVLHGYAIRENETARLKCMKTSRTVFFEDPFRVGIFERIDEGKLSVCKVTFGAEPKKEAEK